MLYAYSPLDSKNAKTRLPSVIAELDAHVPSFIDGARGRSSWAVRSHLMRPVRRSMASTMKRCTSRGCIVERDW